MLKKGIIVVVCVAVALSLGACKKGTVEDAKKDLASLMSVYDGYFDVLAKNKANPADGIKAGQKYVDEKKKEVAEIAKRLNKNPQARDLMDQFTQDIQEKSSKRGQELAPVYGKFKDDLSKQMTELASAAQ